MIASAAHNSLPWSTNSDGSKICEMLGKCQEHHRKGNLAGAEAGYRQILKTCPDHPDALHLLGVLLRQKGKEKESLDLIARAVRIDPDHPVYWASLGDVWQQIRRNEEALFCYRRAIRMNPNLPDIYFNMGNALRAMGKGGPAIQCYVQTLCLEPSHVKARFNLAGAHLDLGNDREAEAGFRWVVKLKPDLAQAHLCAGIAARRLHKNAEAVSCFRKALSIQPDLAEAWFYLAEALRVEGINDAAAEGYRRAISLKPECLEAWNNLGTVLKTVGDLMGAIVCHRQVTRIKPDLAEGHYNLGSALKAKGYFPEAARCFRTALRLKPDYGEAHNNLGLALKFQGLLDPAIDHFRHACRILPNLAEARWNLSLTLLLSGRYREGWQEFESRFRIGQWKAIYPHRLPYPRWDGNPALGKTILVHDEQGLGDTIQFVRYLPLVKARCKKLVFETRKSLMGLFHGHFGIDAMLARSPDTGPAVPCDMVVPLMSLPEIFGTTVDTVPRNVPYLFALPEKVVQWEKRIPPGAFRVGIVWAGRPEHPNDRNRSCPQDNFRALSEIPGVWICGLQKRARSTEKDSAHPFPMVNLGDTFGDFTDTAAAIHCLDLVITVDTSVAHLAGAMGKPVWVLLPHIPDWRWMMGHEDTPWYPTMRLFRQNRPEDWEGVLLRVEETLRLAVSGRSAPGRKTGIKPLECGSLTAAFGGTSEIYAAIHGKNTAVG